MLSYHDWQAERLAALTAPTGWLNLTDRVDTAPGRHSVGSAPGQDIVLSVGPAQLGTLVLGPDGAALETAAGRLPFQAKGSGYPQLAHAGLILEIHTVDDIPALRVRQVDHPGRLGFVGLQYFPFDPDWVIRARWERLAVPQAARIDLKGGGQDAVTVTHRALFSRDGREIVLTATHWKGDRPQFVFRDATSGRQTYGAARFLIGEDATDSEITLDFNRAYSPPCAFTDFAICPLPPPGNVLPFAVTAGELAPAH
jgi:uncharacterized protein (DUF1684 family)